MRKDTNNLKFILTITPFLSKSNTKDWNLEETKDNGCTDTTDIVTIQFSFRAIYIYILMLYLTAIRKHWYLSKFSREIRDIVCTRMLDTPALL